MASNLKVEELTRGVKGVQDAKSSLEHRLNDRRSKRKEAEKVLESVNAKFSQVKHLHSKMMETVKVAQHKVSLTQAQCSRNEEENKQKKQALLKLEEENKENNEARTEDIKKFEEELSKLSAFLIDAKQQYTGPKLKENIANTDNQTDAAKTQLHQIEDEEVVISNSLQTLDLGATQKKDMAIDKENIWNLITVEQKAALDYIKKLNDEIDSLSKCVPLKN